MNAFAMPPKYQMNKYKLNKAKKQKTKLTIIMIEIKEIKSKNSNKNLFPNFVCINFRHFTYDTYWRAYPGSLTASRFSLLYRAMSKRPCIPVTLTLTRCWRWTPYLQSLWYVACPASTTIENRFFLLYKM